MTLARPSKIKLALMKLEKNEEAIAANGLPLSALNDMLKGRSVAIIGNARKLQDMDTGREIDGHDIVVRINAAPGRIAKSHGDRTDWLATSTPVRPGLISSIDPKVLLWMTRKLRRLPHHYLAHPGFYLNKASVNEALRKELPANPTTGLMIIDLVAASQARAIDLYGFDFFASQSLSGRRTASDVPHDFGSERAWVEALLARDPRVTLHKME